MTHTNVDLDEKLVTEAMELTRTRNEERVDTLDCVNLSARLRAAREHRGKFHWRGNLATMREENTHDWRSPSGRHKRSD